MRAFKNIFNNSFSFKVGFILLVLFVFIIILSFFAPQDPQKWGTVPPGLPPSVGYPLGTTGLGQNVFWLITYAVRNSMELALLTSFISVAIAMVFGFLAGHLAGTAVGEFLDLIIESFCVIPGLPVLIIFAFIFKSSISLVLIALVLSIFGWAWPAKELRSIVMDLKERKSIRTAEFSGLSIGSIIFREYMPFVLPWLLMQLLGLMNWSIGMEASIAIFGLSAMNKATIGTTIYWAMAYEALLLGEWWWLFVPVFVVILLMVSVYLVSISVSEYSDPRIRLSRILRRSGKDAIEG